MAKFHYLLTGGTGFFGRALIRRWTDIFSGTGVSSGTGTFPGEVAAGRIEALPNRESRVTVLSRAPDAFLRNHPNFASLGWLTVIKGDILDPTTLPSGQVFSHVLHAAADSTLGPQLSPLQRFDQIVNGTKNILDFAVQNKVSRFLFASSGAVYGPQPSELNLIPEDWRSAPDSLNSENAYAVGKRTAEHLCVLYRANFGLETVIARCFAFVGQDLPLDVHFAIGNFIRDALMGGPIVVKGDGTAVRSFLDQRDLAEWLIAIAERGRAGEAYNVGSDQEISIGELAELVRVVVEPNSRVSIQGKPDPNALRHRYVPAIDKIKRDLGVEISIPLADAIRAASELARSNGYGSRGSKFPVVS